MNPPRAKGTRAESAAARWLTDELGIPITRAPLAGNADKGDLLGLPDHVVEVKNCKTPTLREWGREVAAEQRNADVRRGVVLWSPPGVGMDSVGKWIVFEWDRLAPGDRHVVPHIGQLNHLHRYVEGMQAWGFTPLILAGSSWVSARWAESWLYEVREALASRTPIS